MEVKVPPRAPESGRGSGKRTEGLNPPASRPGTAHALHVTLEAGTEVTEVCKRVQVLRLGPAGRGARRGRWASRREEGAWKTKDGEQVH